MADGAHLGVSAGRALGTILGGQPQPADKERASIEEMEKRIRSRPLPGDGEKPWEKAEGVDAYSFASDCIAHCFLVLADEDPELLTKEYFYDEEYISTMQDEENRKWFRENMLGTKRESARMAWDAMSKRWPNVDDWLGGASGFMVGWAFNAARAIKSLPPAENPAIMHLGASKQDDDKEE